MLNIQIKNGQFRFSLGMPGYGDPITWGRPCDPRDPRVDLSEEDESEAISDNWEYEEQLRERDYDLV